MADAVHFELGDDGVALLTIDVAEVSMNIITPAYMAEMHAALDRVAGEEAIKGAVIASGKAAFMGGADLKSMIALVEEGDPALSRAARVASRVAELSKLHRRVETIGKPIAIAVNGTNMGGGFELMLACHYRVVSNDPRLKMGLPEVLVGLLPGAGGTQRLPRLMGVQPALPFLLQGKSMNGAEALAMGVVHEIAPVGEIAARARAWVLKATLAQAVSPWDVKGFRFPGGVGMFNPGFVQTFVGANAMVQKETMHNMNAPQAILSCVYEGSQLPINRALAVEVKYMTKLFLSPQSGAMIRTLFINKQAAEKGARRPADVAPMPTKKVAMVGAGLMGAGIAMVSAQAGIEVALLDRDLAAAEKGKAYTAERLEKRRTDPAKMAQVLGRIHPTMSYDDLRGVDLIIEAVFEDPALKKDVTAKIAAAVGPDVMYGSNTSTLPITGLQANWPRPENFIGIHFFSPVDKMQLVEIIVGKATGPTVIAKALDYVRAIGKTPIVVNDSRGFYTSRCFATYVEEGATMVGEGVLPALIENCGRMAGMPVGPLAVGDEVAIDLMGRIKASMISEMGAAYTPGGSDRVIDRMLELDRKGRKNAKGFYDYPAEKGAKKRLWPGLANEFPVAAHQPAPREVMERLGMRQVAECVRCMEEGVLVTAADGDLGAIFGWGFAPFTGGPFSLVDTLGAGVVADKLDALAAIHGPRFAAPKLLRDMAARGSTFHGEKMRAAA